MSDTAFRATLERLYGLRRFGMRPGLEVMRELLSGLGNPQDSFRAIHITGSKGKGSVAAMSASILSSATPTVGLYTSPHLQRYPERIQIDRTPISPADVVHRVGRVEEVAEKLQRSGKIDRAPTFFEVTTALAFDHFARHGAAHAAIEVGIGGRLDATNVIHAPVGVITSIELEHTEILGSTLKDIAREKAGILHKGMRAVLGSLRPEAKMEIDRVADAEAVACWQIEEEIKIGPRELHGGFQRFSVETPRRSLERVVLPLHGAVQARNAGLAIAAADLYAEATGLKLTDEGILRALRRTEWRGRLERVSRRPEVYADVAHTPDSVQAVVEAMAELRPFAPAEETAVVFGCLQDKRVDEIFESVRALARTVVVVPVRSGRAMPASELRRAAHGRFPRVVEAHSLADALMLAKAATGPDGYTIVVGSDYLVGELLDLVEGRAADEPDLSDPGLSTEANSVSAKSEAAR